MMTWLHRCNHPYAYAGQYLALFRQHGENGFTSACFVFSLCFSLPDFCTTRVNLTPAWPETRFFTVMW